MRHISTLRRPRTVQPRLIRFGRGTSPTFHLAVRGKYYYLYLIEDIYSRKAVGWEVYDHESGERAA